MSFTYYYRNRPPGIGCQPDGFDLYTREYWCPRKEIDGVPYHGVVSYPTPLTPEQIWQYELRPADLVEYAEFIFWEDGRADNVDMREDYLNTDRADLESMSQFSKLAQAALTILDARSAQEENTNASP